MLQYLRQVAGSSSLLLGAGDGELVAWLRSSMAVEPDETKHHRLRNTHAAVKHLCAVGTNLGVAPRSFESSIVSDYWRALDPQVVLTVVKEALRVAGRAFVLYTPEFDVPTAPGSRPACTPAELNSLLDDESFGPLVGGDRFRIREAFHGAKTTVLEILAC